MLSPARHTPAAAVYAVVLNWNGWQDSIECLDSLLASDHGPLKVLLCDNGSTDGSLDYLRRWAQARGEPLRELSREQALNDPPDGRPQPRLTLVANGENLGYAAGNNIGLRLAMAQADCGFLWLVNNDAVVRPDTLSHMLERLQRDPRAGCCGATLVDHDRPGRIQAQGGACYNSWLGRSQALGAGLTLADALPAAQVESRMDYVIGACSLVTRAWAETVGLLSEDYFLYYEEIDWSARARKHFKLVYAPRAVVRHKLGASIGGPAGSARIDGLALRNRLRFTRRHRPWALPTVWLGLGWALLNRLRRRQWRRVPVVVSVMLGRWRLQP